MRVLLAVNDRARRGRDARGRTAEALRARGHEVIDLPTGGEPGDLSKAIAAHRDRADAVLLGGGDGTVVSALEGLIEAKLPLTILPLGTFNELARTLGVPHEPEQAAELVGEGVPLSLDVGCVNGRYYVNEASLGLSTSVVALQTGDVKRRLGILAIPLTTLRALRWMRPMHLEIEDSQGHIRRVRAVQLTVANSYRFGGVVENPQASLEDGRLWLYSIDVRAPLHALGLLAAIAARRFQQSPEVIAVRGTRFTVRSVHGRAYRVTADAEPVTELPAEFTIVPRAINVMVPPSRVPAIR